MFKMDGFKEKAQKILRQYLFQTNLNLEAKDQFNHLQKMRYRIAEMYKRHIEALYDRVYCLSKVFDDEIGYLVAFYQKKKKGANQKKNNKMIVKLNTIKPEIKERVLLLYLNRMKFYFTIKTLKWFLLFRSDDYDLEDVSIPHISMCVF